MGTQTHPQRAAQHHLWIGCSDHVREWFHSLSHRAAASNCPPSCRTCAGRSPNDPHHVIVGGRPNHPSPRARCHQRHCSRGLSCSVPRLWREERIVSVCSHFLGLTEVPCQFVSVTTGLLRPSQEPSLEGVQLGSIQPFSGGDESCLVCLCWRSWYGILRLVLLHENHSGGNLRIFELTP